MSPPGRPKGESLSAQREGRPLTPPGRPKGESLSAQREGRPLAPPGRPKGESLSAQREGHPLAPPDRSKGEPPGAQREGSMAIGAESGRAPRGPLFDPESIPHDPTFVDPAVRGPAVPAERLHGAAVRARVAAPPPWTPEIRTDGRWRTLEVAVRPAAVLLPLVARAGVLQVLLTQRTAHLHDHAGQISFPGGRVDDGDRDAVHTALREAEEEIGLPAAAVEVLGTLPEYVTATGYAVTPVIGLIERPFALALDSFEVAEAFEVPLPFLMDPANHERRRIEFAGALRTFYAMPWTHAQRRYFIWGATAAMLRNFYHLLRA